MSATTRGQFQPRARRLERQVESVELTDAARSWCSASSASPTDAATRPSARCGQGGGLRMLVWRGACGVRARSSAAIGHVATREVGVDQPAATTGNCDSWPVQGGQPGPQDGDGPVRMALRGQHLRRDHHGTRQVSPPRSASPRPPPPRPRVTEARPVRRVPRPAARGRSRPTWPGLVELDLGLSQSPSATRTRP